MTKSCHLLWIDRNYLNSASVEAMQQASEDLEDKQIYKQKTSE